MKLQRIFAYLIDILIVSFISTMLFSVLFKEDYEKYNELTKEYVEHIASTGSTGLELNDKDEEDFIYNFTKASTTSTVIIISLEIIYFIFIQYFLNGETLGKKLFKIQVIPEKGKKLSAGLFVLREIIVLTLPFKIIDLIAILTVKQSTFIIISNITSKLTMLTYLAILGTLIFRNDERGLHDLLCKTKVIKKKEVLKLEGE